MPATTRSATKRRGRNDRSDGIRRQRSSDDLTESDAIANLNVNWVGNWFFFWYIIGILLFRWCCHLVAWTHGATAWTTTHFVHGFIMFLSLHWVKGTPTEMNDQDHYRNYTWWEQLDGGVQWTYNRKVFMLVPILLYLLTNYMTAHPYHTSDELKHLVVNTVVLGFQLIPKLPAMHKVRVAGINSES